MCVPVREWVSGPRDGVCVCAKVRPCGECRSVCWLMLVSVVVGPLMNTQIHALEGLLLNTFHVS